MARKRLCKEEKVAVSPFKNSPPLPLQSIHFAPKGDKSSLWWISTENYKNLPSIRFLSVYL